MYHKSFKDMKDNFLAKFKTRNKPLDALLVYTVHFVWKLINDLYSFSCSLEVRTTRNRRETIIRSSNK